MRSLKYRRHDSVTFIRRRLNHLIQRLPSWLRLNFSRLSLPDPPSISTRRAILVCVSSRIQSRDKCHTHGDALSTNYQNATTPHTFSPQFRIAPVAHLAQVYFLQRFKLRDRPVQPGMTLAHYGKQMRHTQMISQRPRFGRMAILRSWILGSLNPDKMTIRRKQNCEMRRINAG
jgi:hypothetical protein